MSLAQRSTAEFIGTFWLVLGGCGSAVLSGAGVLCLIASGPAGFAPIAIGLGLWVAPILGAALAGGFYSWLGNESDRG